MENDPNINIKHKETPFNNTKISVDETKDNINDSALRLTKIESTNIKTLNLPIKPSSI